MKHPISFASGLALLTSVSFVSPALAVVSIDYVTVSNVGNEPHSTGYGSVAYEYKIGKNETTVSQYAEFLNATAKADPYGLYNTAMATNTDIAGISRTGISGNYMYTPVPGSEAKPITYVTWFDAARFCNWLHNGQGSGSTETGAYTLNGAISGIYMRVPDAKVWIPSEDEWFKAAFYDATKNGSGDYWLRANQSDTLTGNKIGTAGAANYFDGNSGQTENSLRSRLSEVGAYGAASASYYGTNDQAGNVWEWNDAVIGSSRGLRGGSWIDSELQLRASYQNLNDPRLSNQITGFRIASVPEPRCLVLTILAGGALVTRRKR